MRILILSCHTGEGHNSCAKAICEAAQKRGDACQVEDALRFISQAVSDIVSRSHVFIYRHTPGLFRFAYRYSENHPSLFAEHSKINRLLSRGIEQMAKLITDGQFDTVICTHPFAAMMLTSLQKKHGLTIRTAFVATDYTCSPGVDESDLDRYFIPAAELCSDFTDKTIPANRLVATGIPTKQAFFTKTPKHQAKKQVGVSPDHVHLLVMCGSMGCGPIPKLTDKLASALSDDMEMSVICGTNKRLYNKLKRRHKNCPNLHLYGFTDKVPLLMDSADLYLTKPGGLSVSEAAVKHLPMIFIDAVAGCEEYNRRFFIERGAAITGDASVQIFAERCIGLMRDPAALCRMEEAFCRLPDRDAATAICEEMEQLSLSEKSEQAT